MALCEPRLATFALSLVLCVGVCVAGQTKDCLAQRGQGPEPRMQGGRKRQEDTRKRGD